MGSRCLCPFHHHRAISELCSLDFIGRGGSQWDQETPSAFQILSKFSQKWKPQGDVRACCRMGRSHTRSSEASVRTCVLKSLSGQTLCRYRTPVLGPHPTPSDAVAATHSLAIWSTGFHFGQDTDLECLPLIMCHYLTLGWRLPGGVGAWDKAKPPGCHVAPS